MERDNVDETIPVTPREDGSSSQDTLPTPVGKEIASEDTQPHIVEANLAQEVTQPTPVTSVQDASIAEPQVSGRQAPPDLPPGTVSASRKRRRGWIIWAVLGVLILTLIATSSAYAGYLSAVQQRLSFQSTQVFLTAKDQFDRGVQDMQAGNYDLARQRFEYVIQLDPNYPGVTEMLAQTLLEMNTTATATIAPTPTLTPTPDLRGQEDLYLQAREQMAGGNWSQAIDTLLTLRKKYPDYMVVDVDGLLYVALRNRGVEKISLHQDLEGGTYDLSLAERFGPLDVEATNWRDWAELYIRGASFWDVDWEKAVFYFEQLAVIAPNLMDGSMMTSYERYRQALIGYGNWLSTQDRWCDAQDKFDIVMKMQSDPELEPTASFAEEQCQAETAPEGGGEATLTPSPTGEFSPTPGQGGEATPTPSFTPVPESPTETPTEMPTATQEGLQPADTNTTTNSP